MKIAHLALSVALLIVSLPAYAQPVQALQPQPSKDRKDFIIDALEQQRNQISSGLAICEGTFNDVTAQLRKQIADLNKQVADLTAENTKLKKPADAPPAAAADPAPK